VPSWQPGSEKLPRGVRVCSRLCPVLCLSHSPTSEEWAVGESEDVAGVFWKKHGLSWGKVQGHLIKKCRCSWHAAPRAHQVPSSVWLQSLRSHAPPTPCALQFLNWGLQKLIAAIYADYARSLKSLGFRQGAVRFASKAGAAGRDLLNELGSTKEELTESWQAPRRNLMSEARGEESWPGCAPGHSYGQSRPAWGLGPC
jgi:hypothetical protein